MYLQEKDAAIAKERKDQEDRAEKLRTEYEATRAKYEAQVAAEKDKRIEDVSCISLNVSYTRITLISI